MSMTGYGRATRRAGALTAQAEARSVNGRFLSVRCRLPGELLRLEPRLEALVKSQLARGTVDLHLRVEAERARGLPRIDGRVLAAYRKALAGLGGGDAAALLSLPGVVSWNDDGRSESAVDKVALAAAGQALAQLTAARRAEGRRLATALKRELSTLRRLVAEVRKRVPDAVAQQQDNLQRRLEALLQRAGIGGSGTAIPSDDPGLQRELALLADRSDISEELDRLDSHLAALGQALAGTKPAGRELDFLLQEVGREVNTLGSKCSDARIVALVVQAKGAVERLREQAANIE